MSELERKAIIWFLAAGVFGLTGLFYLEAATGVDPALGSALALQGTALSNPAVFYLLAGLLAFFCAAMSALIGVFRWRVTARLAMAQVRANDVMNGRDG